MRGEPELIDLLNEVLTAELTAVNQYFLDAKMFQDWGLERLGAKFREASVGEMRDAEQLVERILYLDGHPNLQRLSPLRTGENPAEKLTLALEVETEAVERLNRGIARARDLGDNGTRELLEDILEGEESHADWLESQLEAIRQVGDANYLAQQLRD